MGGLLLGWIVLPALAGLYLLVAGHRQPPRVARWVGALTCAIASVCAALALGRVGAPTGVAFVWLPGAGRMALEAGASGLWAAACTTWAASLVLVATWSDARPRVTGLMAIALVSIPSTVVLAVMPGEPNREAWIQQGIQWMIYSYGPDREDQMLGGEMADPVNYLYDPTNGTVSYGDIGRKNIGSIP